MVSASHAKHSSMFFFGQPSGQGSTVRVSNIPSNVDFNEVLSVFDALIGQVVSWKKFDIQHGPELEIQLANDEAIQKAISLSGHSFNGIKLTITNASSTTRRALDDRKNLYVLGLPFSLTKAEFSALFSQYGTVTHSVILATVDNSSRRRGFVVMSSHGEAKLAMKSLSRIQVKGHALDISWAVVQRSQGFLDGGDRALVLDSRPSSGSISPVQSDSTDPTSVSYLLARSAAHHRDELASLAPSSDPSVTLLVSDLPTFLFSEEKDLYPLLCPFGKINRMSIIKSNSDVCVSVLVEYQTTKIAQDAKVNIEGQWYSGYQITAQFVRDVNFPSVNSGSHTSSCLSIPSTPNAVDTSRVHPYLALPDPIQSCHAFFSTCNEQAKYSFPGVPRACHLGAPAAIYSSKQYRRNPFLLHH